MQGVWGGHGGRYAPRGRIRHQRRREAHKPREDGRPGPVQSSGRGGVRINAPAGPRRARRLRQAVKQAHWLAHPQTTSPPSTGAVAREPSRDHATRPRKGQNPHAIRLGAGKGSQTAMRNVRGVAPNRPRWPTCRIRPRPPSKTGRVADSIRFGRGPHPPPRPLAAEPVDATGRASYSRRFPLAGGRAVPNRLRRLAP